MQTQTTVSVIMITYGHEKFIRQAIESILLQNCNFQIEIILANDCSPDNTDGIIQEILKTNKNACWIKYFNHSKNLGMMPNFEFALSKCTGKYIAICEGDDYWIDESKLHKQIEFLEKNQDYAIHSGVAQKIKNNILIDEFIGDIETAKTFALQDFYHQNNIVTCTVLFRNSIKNYPKDFTSVTFGDWYFYVILLNQTNLKAYRSTEVLSVYRIHENGVMKSLSQLKFNQQHISQILKIKKHVGYASFCEITKTRLNGYFISKFKIEVLNYHFFDAIGTFFINLYAVKDLTVFKNYIDSVRVYLNKKS